LDSCLDLGIAALGQAYRRRALSPVEVVDALFDAVVADEAGINAFVLLDRPAALQAAEAAQARFLAGEPLGPLDGIPVSIKDMTDVRGWPTRRGALAMPDAPPAGRDAPVVSALRAAGGVIFGKTTTTEFGWTVLSESPHGGTTRNPRKPARSAGGSSSGAAAQVAAGWGPLAIGSDAGGSVRLPAAFCGLVGIKPTWSAIPQAPLSAFWDVSHLGPFTRSVEDCALALSTIARPDRRDPHSLFARRPLDVPVDGLRLAWSGRGVPMDPAIERGFQGLLDDLRAGGLAVEEAAFDWSGYVRDAWAIWTSKVVESFLGWSDGELERLSPRLRAALAAGREADALALAASRARLRRAMGEIAAIFGTVDILLTPTTPWPAPPLGSLAPTGHPDAAEIEATGNWLLAHPFCWPFNLPQQPALSLPAGTTPDGLPWGLQIVAPKFADGLCLSLARRLEGVLAGG